MSTTSTIPTTDLPEGQFPLWRTALAKIRGDEGFGYGWQQDLSWFEVELGCKRDTAEFAFGLMRIREQIETKDGYYIQTQTVRDDEAGTKFEVAQIPCAADHEEISRGFEGRMRSYASRAIHLRLATLANPDARETMSQEEIARMEKSSEIAATRLILLRRERSIGSWLSKNAPKLLKEEKDTAHD